MFAPEGHAGLKTRFPGLKVRGYTADYRPGIHNRLRSGATPRTRTYQPVVLLQRFAR
jgi:hypothetical protein